MKKLIVVAGGMKVVQNAENGDAWPYSLVREDED